MDSSIPPPPESEDGGAPLNLSVAQAIERGGENCIIFGNIFLPRAFRQGSPDFHFELAELLAGPNRYNAFKVFRDGAKTTLLRSYILQRICYGLSNTIMIVSASQEHSMYTLAWVKTQIERNKRVQEAFGVAKGNKWAETNAEIRIAAQEEPITLLASGITGQLRGFNIDDYRPDLILADDIQTEENVGTEVQANKTKELFFGGLQNSLAPSTEAPLAKLVLLQTPMTKFDVVNECFANPLWVCKKFGIFDENGASRWEERHPVAQLRLEKAAAIKLGKYSVWMREKECEIVKSEYKTFDVTNLQFWTDLPTKHNGAATAIDPASSEDKNASDNVVLTGFRVGADIYVGAYVAAKGQMPDKVANDVFTHKFLFNTTTLLVETVAYQKILKWYIEQEMLKRRVWLAVKEIKDSRAKSDRIIQALVGLVANRHLFIHESMLELVTQLDQFEPDKNGRYDIIDALATLAMHLNSPFAAGNASDMTMEEQLREERRAYGELRFEHGAP